MPVDRSQLERLTPQQRACLRLVARDCTSKHIAQQLGLSQYTVDDHIQAARRILGASTRYDAAAALREAEAAAPPLTSRDEALGIPPAPAIADPEPSAWPVITTKIETSVDRLRDSADRPPFEPEPLVIATPRLPGLEDRNDLTKWSRTKLLLLGPIAIAIAVGMLAIGLDILSKFVWWVASHFG